MTHGKHTHSRAHTHTHSTTARDICGFWKFKSTGFTPPRVLTTILRFQIVSMAFNLLDTILLSVRLKPQLFVCLVFTIFTNDVCATREPRARISLCVYIDVWICCATMCCVYTNKWYATEKRALRNRSHKRQYINWKCASSDFCVSRMILTLTFFTLFAYMLCLCFASLRLLVLPAHSLVRSVVRSLFLSFTSIPLLTFMRLSYVSAVHRVCSCWGLLCVYEAYMHADTHMHRRTKPKTHNTTYHMLRIFICLAQQFIYAYLLLLLLVAAATAGCCCALVVVRVCVCVVQHTTKQK